MAAHVLDTSGFHSLDDLIERLSIAPVTGFPHHAQSPSRPVVYVKLPNGETADGFILEEETLTDGSKVVNLVLTSSENLVRVFR